MKLAEACVQLGAVVVGNELPDARLMPVADSRRVRAGETFFACHGDATVREAHVREAVERGAAAVVTSAPAPQVDAPCLLVNDPRVAYAMASAWRWGLDRGHPPLVGVTGTDGKTTVTWCCWHCRCWLQMGLRPVQRWQRT